MGNRRVVLAGVIVLLAVGMAHGVFAEDTDVTLGQDGTIHVKERQGRSGSQSVTVGGLNIQTEERGRHGTENVQVQSSGQGLNVQTQRAGQGTERVTIHPGLNVRTETSEDTTTSVPTSEVRTERGAPRQAEDVTLQGSSRTLGVATQRVQDQQDATLQSSSGSGLRVQTESRPSATGTSDVTLQGRSGKTLHIKTRNQ